MLLWEVIKLLNEPINVPELDNMLGNCRWLDILEHVHLPISLSFFLLVEDESHSDFLALRTMIIKRSLNDLRDVTHYLHYENYRYKK